MKGELDVIDDDGWKNPLDRQRAMRFSADRICLWCFCDDPACRRAKACRGDVRACAGRMADWLEAIAAARRACPSFAALESRIETAEKLRAYRLWRRFETPAKAAAPVKARR